MSKLARIPLALILLAAVACPLAAQATATDTVTIDATQLADIALLDMGAASVQLSATEIGTATVAGRKTDIHINPGEMIGGRIRFTVGGASSTMKLTARVLTTLAAGVFKVSIVGGPGDGSCGTPASGAVTLGSTPVNLITGIGHCRTGSGSSDGFLVKYSLVGDPGFAVGNVVVEYSLTP